MSRPKAFDLDHTLDAALDTFWSHGYTATSAQDLVDSTGLGRGSLYNAFGSKRGIFVAALQRYESQQTSRLVEMLEREGTPPRERIRAVLMSVVEEESAEATGRRGCLMVNSALELAGQDAGIIALVQRNFARVEEALTACVRSGQAGGTLEKGHDPRGMAQYLLNSMYGLRVLGATSDRRTLSGIVEKVLLPL